MIDGYGIDAWTAGGQAAIGFGELGAEAILVDVRVREADHAEALRILDEYFVPAAEGSASDDAPSWTCESCGEKVEGSFSNCWKCDTARARTMEPPVQSQESTNTSSPMGAEDSAAPVGPRKRVVRAWIAFIGLGTVFGFATKALESPSSVGLPLLLLIVMAPYLYIAIRWVTGVTDRKM